MRVIRWLSWRRATAVLSCAGVLIATAAVAAAASAHSATATATAKCTGANTESWLGLGLGGGTAGSTYYPLEFSNIGHHACTLSGFPAVAAYAKNAAALGPPASHNGQHFGTVTLAPGATAHALLRVIDWGALCSKEVAAAGVKVAPPGVRQAKPIPFTFGACARKGVLTVGPVRAGVGIPGYTTS